MPVAGKTVIALSGCRHCYYVIIYYLISLQFVNIVMIFYTIICKYFYHFI